MAKAKSEIVERKPFEIAAMDMGVNQLKELIDQNIGTEGMDQFDFSRAVNPQGENVEWKIPGIEDEPEKLREVEGVIVYHRKVRVYYETEYKGGGQPPNCSSADAIVGEGNPGGECIECPFEKFGSGKNEGKACRELKQVYMIRHGELLPTLFNVTSVNIRKPNKYLLDLLSKRRLAFNQVITKIRLEPDKSTGGYDYARTDFSLVSVLPAEQQAAMKELTRMFASMLSTAPVTIDIDPVPEHHKPDNEEEVPY